MSTPYVDSLEGNELEFLEKELARLVALENDLAKSKSVCQEKVEEECNKVLDAVRDKVNEHEQADKSLVTLQSKLSQSQAIVDELERTVKRLQNEAERARKCSTLMDAFNSFATSPTKLQEILGENDDGTLSSSLESLADSIRNPDMQLVCSNLKTWIKSRVDDRLSRFDLARRKHHVEEMQVYASYVCKHKRGLDALCDFVAKLALRPLVSAARAPPSKEDIPLLFEQISLSLREGRSTIVLSTADPRAPQRLLDQLIHLTLAEETGLKTLIANWFPPLSAPPPGIALERVEILALTKAQLDDLFEDVLSSSEPEANDLKIRASRLFEPVSKDYFSLEISLLEDRFKSNRPELPRQGDTFDIIDLERLLLGECSEFVSSFLSYAKSAYARASTFLHEDSLEICLETLVACASARVIDEVVVPSCNLSLAFFPATDNLVRSTFETPSHQLMRRSSSLYKMTSANGSVEEDKTSSTSAHQNKYLSQVLIPFVEKCCDMLEKTHEFCEPGSTIHTLVQSKIALAENALEQIVARSVDAAFGLALSVHPPRKAAEVDLEKVDEDESLLLILQSLKESAEEIEPLGEGALTNLALASKEIVLIRLGYIKKVTPVAGQMLAKELNRFAAALEDIFISIESPEYRVFVSRVCAEIRQLAHVFVLPKEDVLRGSMVLDKISRELATECLNKRTY